ncbi:MAG: hypothetical protein IAE94_12565 [Chthoniobacterales bacterium]|nr:hypothetical protein [Chthoniobacterales bacterium]
MTVYSWLAAGFLFFASALHAAPGRILFEDHFDAASENAPLVYGPNTLEHGIWSSNHEGDGIALLSTDSALSPPRSLALKVGAGGRAQVVGGFSDDGVQQLADVTDAYTVRLAFLMKDAVATWEFYISGEGGQPAVIRIDGNAYSYHKSENAKIFGGLIADVWYVLEVSVSPASSDTKSYTANLYDAENALLGSSNGAFQDPEASGSKFFTINHTNPDSTLYLDDITVTAAAKEP